MSEQELRQAVPIMVRIIEDALTSWPPELRVSFWNGIPRAELATTLLDEALSEVRRVVQAKIAAAKKRVSQRAAGLESQAARDALFAALAASESRVLSEHDERRTCPACEYEGWLYCTVGDLTMTVDTGEAEAEITVGREAWPGEFFCNVCELSLEDGELDEVGLGGAIELGLDNDGWEPDEDVMRGR